MEFAEAARALTSNIETVIDGKSEAVATAVVVFLAEGHLLIEDAPGVGKTMLAKALAVSIGGSVRRVQFTADLLPSDITGVSVFDPAGAEFEFKPGPIFANVVIGDEINRASPKTQSAMLEAMQERQVTVDGTTYELAKPFSVIATQNPYEMGGTYELPEAQRDRFMARLRLGYPDREAELAMLRDRDSTDPIELLRPVVSLEQVLQMISIVRAVYVSAAVEEYAVDIGRQTRTHPQLRLGASPRATLQMIRAAKARAAVAGRDFVLPDDLEALALHLLSHRLVADSSQVDIDDIVRTIVAQTPIPR